MLPKDIYAAALLAAERLRGVALHTPLQENTNLSARFNASVFLKREDLQQVRSYKIRGAYNKISLLPPDQQAQGVVCASAGNHAQGVAVACRRLQIKGKIFMPKTTPQQKIQQVQRFGQHFIDIALAGDTFDDALAHALQYAHNHQAPFIPPFDDPLVIAGQATIALEILADSPHPIDYLFLPIGGGGLAAGVASVFAHLSPHTQIIGVEPDGAASMLTSIRNGYNTTLPHIDKFVDGAAVKRVGDLNFQICQPLLSQIATVPEGKVCTTILQLYNEEAMVVEPAGALSIAALDQFTAQIQHKNIVCIVSGSNNDILRTEEIRERALLHEGLKHYFLIQFPQRPGALKEFVSDVLGPDDDITYFQFQKKTNKEKGPAVVGIELKDPAQLQPLLHRLELRHFAFQYLNQQSDLFSHLIG